MSEFRSPSGALVALGAVLMAIALILSATSSQAAAPGKWHKEWPHTDFSKTTIEFNEIKDGGPPKDGIPAIDNPQFQAVDSIENLENREPVILLKVGEQIRVYPLRILMWHEIVNDKIGAEYVAVTYCPLCNAAIVFSRKLDGNTLSFGTTGKLRNSDLIMYDRLTESWWQQYTGEAIIGSMTGQVLKPLPSRLVPWSEVRERYPDAQVLVPAFPRSRPYGSNPYVGYENSGAPFMFDGHLPRDIRPMRRVIVVVDRAWSLELLRERKTIEDGSLVLQWTPGQASALDRKNVADGRDVGTITVQRTENGRLVDVHHTVTFAFVFRAFNPEGPITAN